jgi:phage terminase small subunit
MFIKRTQAEYDEMVRQYNGGMSMSKPTWNRRPTKEEKRKLNRMKRKTRLNFNEGKFIEGMAKGLNQKDSAIYAGYAPLSASTTAYRLMRKEKIIKELEKVGLTDAVLSDAIKVNMEAGMGIKATADTSLKAVELALKLKGHLQAEEKGGDTNIQINDLRQMSDEDLRKRMEVLTGEIVEPDRTDLQPEEN